MERLIFEAKIPHLKNMNSKNFSLWILALALLLMGLFGVLLFSPFLCMLLCIAGIVVTCVLLLRYNKCDAKSNLVPCNIGLIADSETVRWMLQRHTDDKYSDITGYDLDKEYIAVGDFYMNGNEFSARMFGGDRASFYFVNDEDKAKALDIFKKLGWDVVIGHDASEYFAPIPRTPRPYNKKSDAAKAEAAAAAAADAEQAKPSKKKTDAPAATKATAAKKSTTSSSSKKKAPAPAEKEPAEEPAPAEDKAEA
jgi:hypothetical protein